MQQQHAATLLRMQAEVQTLQDQLAFARAKVRPPYRCHRPILTLPAAERRWDNLKGVVNFHLKATVNIWP
jgi:hypothetical protein